MLPRSVVGSTEGNLGEILFRELEYFGVRFVGMCVGVFGRIDRQTFNPRMGCKREKRRKKESYREDEGSYFSTQICWLTCLKTHKLHSQASHTHTLHDLRVHAHVAEEIRGSAMHNTRNSSMIPQTFTIRLVRVHNNSSVT